jgi:hypothetical protein
MVKPSPYTETKQVMDLMDMWAWIDEKYNITARDYAGRFKGEFNSEAPYQDFWHFQIDLFNNFSNDSYQTLNLTDQLEACEEDWQREISQLWIDEYEQFANEEGEIYLWVSW